MDVAISYVASVEKAEVEKLKAKGVRALAIQGDQAETAAAKPLIESVVAQFGRLDILVNDAAVVAKSQTVDDPALDTTALDRLWQVNIMCAVATTRGGAGALRPHHLHRVAQPHPRSVSAVADYAGTKAAINGYARGVARDLGARNITVNVVQPGAMPTDMMAEVFGGTVAPHTFLDLHPIRRIATLEEASALVCFLAGPNSRYMTGGVIDVDCKPSTSGSSGL